jgi:acyl homoserine lactone synthase
MLRILTAPELDRLPHLRDAMLRDRAAQFRDRLCWPVAVDDLGRERDEYDHAGALYVIVQGPHGAHQGSARFLPTVGPHMAADHFAHLIGGPLRSPLIWEVTRFCLAPGAGRHVAPLLMLGGAEVMRLLSLTHLLGVFDLAMLRVYAGIGAMPEVLGTQGNIGAGLWAEGAEARARLLRRARLRPEALPDVIDAPALAPDPVLTPAVTPAVTPVAAPRTAPARAVMAHAA